MALQGRSHHQRAFEGSVPFGSFASESLEGRNGPPSPATGTWRISPSTPSRAPPPRRRPTSKLTTGGPPPLGRPLLCSSRKRQLPLIVKHEDEVDQPASQCQVGEADSNIDAENSTKRSGLREVNKDVA